MTRTPSTTLETDRLVLRAPGAADAQPIQALCGNWDVVRMTTRMPHPYTLDDARSWISGRGDRWADGTEYTFALVFDDAVVGVAGVDLKEGACSTASPVAGRRAPCEWN
jgi:8-oxo-dGTP diphosphatase